MSRARYFFCVILLIQFGGCMAVDVNIIGRKSRGIDTSSNDTTNPEIRDLPFPGESRALGVDIVDSSCNLEDQLLKVNPDMAIAQQTDFWCWAATPQMIIKFHDPGNDLKQCQIITDIKLNGRSRDGRPICCPEPIDVDCLQNGRPEDVLKEKRYTFGSWIYSNDNKLRATQIREQLCTNGIFPHIVLQGDNGGHVVNVTNITQVGENIYVEVFDPQRGGSFTPVPYEAFKEGYIGNYGVKYEIDRDLVGIKKPQ